MKTVKKLFPTVMGFALATLFYFIIQFLGNFFGDPEGALIVGFFVLSSMTFSELFRIWSNP